MNKLSVTLALAVLLAAPLRAHAQSAAVPTVVDSRILVGTGYPVIESKDFRSQTTIPLPQNSTLTARGEIGPHGLTRMLSLRQIKVNLGSSSILYPAISQIRCSNFPYTGEFVRVIASDTAIKVNLGSSPLHSGGYLIQAGRPIKSGESLPTVRVVFQGGTFIFSFEQTPQMNTPDAQPKPALIIAPEHATADNREVALEAWRLANRSAREGLPH
jgi:hypothetical protein